MGDGSISYEPGNEPGSSDGLSRVLYFEDELKRSPEARLPVSNRLPLLRDLFPRSNRRHLLGRALERCPECCGTLVAGLFLHDDFHGPHVLPVIGLVQAIPHAEYGAF
jgi:hypothetical protein